MVEVYIPEQQYDKNISDQYFDYARAGTLDVLGATFEETLYYNPANALARLQEQYLGEGTTGAILSKEEYLESEYFREGVEVGDEGIKTGLASLLAERVDRRDAFNTTLSRSKGGLGTSIAQFGVAVAGSVLDPLNIASAFIPAVGTARAATLASRYGKNGSRAMVGAIDGAVGAAVVEPLVIGAAIAEQDKDYGLMDSFLNIAVGSALGGGLHVGFGAISDKINRLPPKTRDATQRISLGQALNDENVSISQLIDDVEAKEIADGVRLDDKIVVYDVEGKPSVVDIVDVDAEGNITIRDATGNVKNLDSSDVFSKSVFDDDFEVTIGNEVITKQRLKNANAGEILQILNSLENIKNQASESGDTVTFNKVESVEEAINLEKNRREGVELERPAEPDVRQARQKQIQGLEEDIQKFEAKIKQRTEAEGLEKPRLSEAERKEYNTKQERLQDLQSKLQRADKVVQIKEGNYTPQQIDDIRDSQSIGTRKLGRLDEYKDEVKALEEDTIEPDELDPDEIEAENQLLEQELQADDVQAILPNDLKQSIKDVDKLNEKAEKYEEISRAGAACVIRTKS
jgi:hypothetical protein